MIFMRVLTLMKYCRLAVGAAAVIVAGVLLTACPVATPFQPEMPEPAPLPGLLGTWRATYDYWGEGDQIVGTFVDTLTFTSERYILHRAHYLADGTLDHRWANSGTWKEPEEGELERIWVDDDGQTFTVRKSYHWGASRNVLYLHHWEDEDPLTDPVFNRYERVTFDPAVLIGKWEWDRTDQDPDDPRFFEAEITLDIVTFRFNPFFDPEEARTFTQEGTYTLDPATLYLDMEIPERPDVVMRLFALAPTDNSPIEILVSAYWDERGNNLEERPYGSYWLHMRKSIVTRNSRPPACWLGGVPCSMTA